MIKVGIDIGGTFTDFIVISNNKIYKNKVLTSVKNPYISFIEGLNEIFEFLGLPKKSAKEIGIRVFEKAYCNDGVDGGCHEEERDGVHHRNDGLRKRAYNNP